MLRVARDPFWGVTWNTWKICVEALRRNVGLCLGFCQSLIVSGWTVVGTIWYLVRDTGCGLSVVGGFLGGHCGCWVFCTLYHLVIVHTAMPWHFWWMDSDVLCVFCCCHFWSTCCQVSWIFVGTCLPCYQLPIVIIVMGHRCWFILCVIHRGHGRSQ